MQPLAPPLQRGGRRDALQVRRAKLERKKEQGQKTFSQSFRSFLPTSLTNFEFHWPEISRPGYLLRFEVRLSFSRLVEFLLSLSSPPSFQGTQKLNHFPSNLLQRLFRVDKQSDSQTQFFPRLLTKAAKIFLTRARPGPAPAPKARQFPSAPPTRAQTAPRFPLFSGVLFFFSFPLTALFSFRSLVSKEKKTLSDHFQVARWVPLFSSPIPPVDFFFLQ